jgi:hypothetical protein
MCIRNTEELTAAFNREATDSGSGRRSDYSCQKEVIKCSLLRKQVEDGPADTHFVKHHAVLVCVCVCVCLLVCVSVRACVYGLMCSDLYVCMWSCVLSIDMYKRETKIWGRAKNNNLQ